MPDGNGTQRDIGVLEGKVEALAASQQRLEDRVHEDFAKVFDKMDEQFERFRGVVAESSDRIHKRIDEQAASETTCRKELGDRIGAMEKAHDGMKTNSMQASGGLAAGISVLLNAIGMWLSSKIHTGGN